MAKSRAQGDGDTGAPANASRVRARLHHAMKVARAATKKARQFELQRQVRRCKQSVDGAQDAGAELAILKHMDVPVVASRALTTKLAKARLLPRKGAAPKTAFPLTELAEEVGLLTHESGAPADADPALAERVLHQVHSSKVLADALATCVAGLRASESEYSSDDGLGEGAGGRAAPGRQKRMATGNMDNLDTMVASGSDTESEDDVRAGTKRRRADTDEEPPSDTDDDDGSEGDTFLPSLATGFVPGRGGDDDWSDAEADYADNARGPAKTGEDNENDARGYDVEDVILTWQNLGKEIWAKRKSHKNNAAPRRRGNLSATHASLADTRKKMPPTHELHPSWAARQLAKAKAAQLDGLKPEYHDVVVIGGGLSGISVACKLKDRLKVTDVAIVEKIDGPAGTWEANTYPGCACDIPAPVYSYSFRQKNDWSSFFAPQPEIRAYIHQVVAEYGIRPCFRFRTVGREARYDDATGLWHVIIESLPDPKNPSAPTKVTHMVSKVLFMAVGGLSQPNPCTIPGKENFKGPLFHSARWDHSVDLKNKNVIVVGNGCSATQFLPIIVDEAKQVTQFVRSKHWYAPPPKVPLDKIPGWRWLLRHMVFFVWLQRFVLWLVLESHFMMAINNSFGQLLRNDWERKCRNHVRKNAPKKYHDQLLPKHGELLVQCRRRILDDKYLPALNRENMDLETTKLAKIEEDAVITEDGRRVPADVIIMANGFNPQTAGFPLEIRGRNGTLHEHYDRYGGGSMMAYHTVFNAGFPNMSFIIGPNAGTGHMSVIFTSERAQELAIAVGRETLVSQRPSDKAIAHLPGAPVPAGLDHVPTFEVKLDAELKEQHWIDKRMQDLVFTKCDSWYRDGNSGRVTAVYPDWQWKLALRCWFPVWRDFAFTNMPDHLERPPMPLWQRFGCWLGLGSTPSVQPANAPETDEKKKLTA
ncbi:hypothetical protein MSPP1_000393 [Malassezia sp. CBS 17886]|nr:hypothetical protein MSPP1_000393 [Malassezia sp. CBS 17886]